MYTGHWVCGAYGSPHGPRQPVSFLPNLSVLAERATMTSCLQVGGPVRARGWDPRCGWGAGAGWATHAMELHVEAAGIAHRLTLGVAAPQRGGGGLAVGTGQAHPAGSRLQQRSRPFMSKRKARCCFYVRGSPEGLSRPEWVARSSSRALKNLRAAEGPVSPLTLAPPGWERGRTGTSAAGGQ